MGIDGGHVIARSAATKQSLRDGGFLFMPGCGLLVGIGCAQQGLLGEMLSYELHTHRQAVHKSCRYGNGRDAGDIYGQCANVTEVICTGSSAFSPILKATVGEVGVISTSYVSNARSKSRLISVRTFCALR